MAFEEYLVSGKELIGIKKKRSQIYTFNKFEPELMPRKEDEGWELDKALKNQVRMKKVKPLDERFEDEVWNLFASLGFKYMSRDRHLAIPYSTAEPSLTQQIDVFAADDETILFVECKCARVGKKENFKKEAEAIQGIREGLFREARRAFPDRRIKYIFATKNYEVSDQDRKRLKEFGIQHFDEYAIRYFHELAKHLGECARFQLLGNLFEGQKIGSLDNRIPAIEGKMGGYTYYSFSIEPEKLLKIAYVLHRNEANNDMMPTYQRIIKKARLKEIQRFIDGGGFFPNSLIISVDTKGKKLQFDLATPQIDDSISRIGILHLPQLYRSAYIVDGQHRLYGYAASKFVSNNSIPVVAFENLAKDKQVELFMEINENQKSVSKNLQNTLNADLLWDDIDWNKRRKALRLIIAQRLGEAQASPLFGRVIIGENESSPLCCISTDTIENALKSTNFFTKYSKTNVIAENGTYDKGDNAATRNVFLPFLTQCFGYIRDNATVEWEKENSVLVINNTIHALIRIFNDILNYLIKLKKVNPQNDTPSYVATEMEYYLAPLITYFNSFTEEQRNEIRTNYGSGGKARVWRIFQKIIADARSEFNPDGLIEWVRDNTKQFNMESVSMLRDLEDVIKKDFAQKLNHKYGSNWVTAGLPPKVYKQANNSMGNKNYDNSINGINKTVNIWDCVTLAHCRDIAVFGANWTELFEGSYTRPNEQKLSGGKIAKTDWILTLSKIASNDTASYSISEEEYLFIKSLHEWLIGTPDRVLALA